ncbi:MAG: hypothetical protein COB61_012235 [Thiotrichales bacterium]|nr:hypothetical protein [Thiotrichales bacterium]
MKRIHIALSTTNIAASVADYSQRLNCEPSVVIDNEYALWRTATINLSIRHDAKYKSGELRHLGWEDSSATEFTSTTDVNGILWENFSAKEQAKEIKEIWPGAGYVTKG